MPPATVADVLAWDGWKGVGVSASAVPSWPSYPKTIPPPRPDDSTATVFKLKVFVLTRAELDPLGVERASLLPSMVDRTRTALRNVQSIVRDASGGRLDVSLAIAPEEEPLDLSSGESAIADYVRTRINGGLFDAEDGIDRGPYSGVLVVEPGAPSVSTVVAGTPIRTVDFYTAGGQVEGTDLEAYLLESVLTLMGDRLREHGGTVLPPDAAPSEGWPDLRSTPADALPALRPGLEGAAGTSASPSSAGVAWRVPAVGHTNVPGLAYGPIAIYFEPDPERGTVLRYREASELRLGGVRLPIDTFPAGKNLAFWTRVSAREGLSLRAKIGKTPEGTPLSQAIRTEETIMGPLEAERGADLPLDGAWHRIVVAIPPGTSELTIGPSLARMGLSRRDSALVNVWFDDFEWTDEAPTPIVDGPSRAAAERLGSATPSDLATLLADPSGRVRARALTLVPAGAADLEPLVLARAAEIDPAVAREAVKALTRIGTPSALLAVRRILTVGPNEA
ncbi:HEAT repeat domain-containing protein, partial [bacterium]